VNSKKTFQIILDRVQAGNEFCDRTQRPAFGNPQTSGGGQGTLKHKDREASLKALMTVNLLKRLESSVESFRITLGKLARLHLSMLAKIDDFEHIAFLVVEEPAATNKEYSAEIALSAR
jgi:hypothetical protein